jgi:hypothetical protein
VSDVGELDLVAVLRSLLATMSQCYSLTRSLARDVAEACVRAGDMSGTTI